MGLTLQLTGTYPKTTGLIRRAHLPPQKFLAAAQQWFERNAADSFEAAGAYQVGPSTFALGLSLHPASENLELTCGEGGKVEASVKTSTTGPGFHAYVCDLMKTFGRDMNITWDEIVDETGYFESGDFAAVERQMFQWLGQVAQAVLQHVERGYTEMAISMPTDYSFHHDGAIGTVMGPRSERWLREVLDHPPRGGDMFPWRERGAGAPYHLGRALTLMWTEVRWVKPFTEWQSKLLTSVLASLEKAHALDPSLNYPWREWVQIATLLGQPVPPHVQAAAASAAGDLIGYRRGDVTARPIGEWSIDVPGHFDAIANEDGSWQTFDGSRSVYLSELIVQPQPGEPVPRAEELLQRLPSDLPAGSRPIEHRTDRVVARADVVDSGFELTGMTAVPGRICICTINATPADAVWAEATWRSITHPTVEV